MQDHRGQRRRVLAQQREGVVLRRTRVDHHGKLRASGQLELRLEGAALVVAGRVVAVVVEPGLADRPGARVRRGALDLLERGLVEAGALVRVASHDRDHLVVVLRRGQRVLDRRAVHPHRRQPRDARRTCPADELGNRWLARVQVAVGVDHRWCLRRPGPRPRPWERAGRARRPWPRPPPRRAVRRRTRGPRVRAQRAAARP